MEEIVTFIAEDHCFSPSGYHDALPCFFAFHILELPDVMHFEVSPSSRRIHRGLLPIVVLRSYDCCLLGLAPFPSVWGFRLCCHRLYLG